GRQAGGDPGAERLVLLAAAADADAAAVRHLPGRLPQEQALLGRGGEHAPAARLLGERRVVGGRGGAGHPQLEAVLPLRLAVAAGGVAAVPAQERDDVVLEVEAARRVGPRRVRPHGGDEEPYGEHVSSSHGASRLWTEESAGRQGAADGGTAAHGGRLPRI